MDYVGLDVPVVAEELQKITDSLGLKKTHPIYMGGDATNAASVASAADLLNGEVLIAGCAAGFSFSKYGFFDLKLAANASSLPGAGDVRLLRCRLREASSEETLSAGESWKKRFKLSYLQ